MKITGVCTGLAILAGALAAWAAGTPGTASAPAIAPWPNFTNLPAPLPHPDAATRANVRAGTGGLALPAPAPAGSTRTTIALLGDLAPGDPDEREKLLRTAVSEINLLRPDAVLTVGNLIAGLTRSGTAYVEQTRRTRVLLDDLKMPWYPCVGYSDTFSGTRDPTDRRFADLYQRYVGPLYFSADIGGAEAAGGPGIGGFHVIVLDSHESASAALSDAQLQWLRADLNRTFDQSRAQGVILLMHRPLWQQGAGGGGAGDGGNWDRVHELLVAFNRRPIAIVEGGPMVARGPRVLAVFAGERQAYDQETPRDGIRYCVLGATAAAPRLGQAAEAVRHFTLLKLDGTGEMHAALVPLEHTGADAPTILPEDLVTAKERAVLDAISSWNDSVLGIDGIVDERGIPLGPALRFYISNPLPEACDVQLRLAPGGGWDFTTAPFQRHIAAAGVSGANASVGFGLRRIRAGLDLPVVEALVRWPDARSRVHEVVLRRPIAVAPSLDIPVADRPLALEAGDWAGAPGGSATPWTQEPDRPRKADPVIAVRADGERVLVQVRVADAAASYGPSLKLDANWGGIASDGVSLAWAKADRQIQRIWVLPFSPATASASPPMPEIWTNAGLGEKQSPLQRLDPKLGIQAAVKLETGRYSVTFSLPRKLICDEILASQPGLGLPLITPPPPATWVAATTTLNVAVHDNDETARTWTKSWTLEQAGPEAWAHLQLIQPSPAPPGLHLP